MSKSRSNMFEQPILQTESKPKPDRETIRKGAAAAAQEEGFQSRESRKPKPSRARRTGRNVQFNMKATPETIDAYYAIADSQNWGLGETLEKAVALLQEKYPSK